MTPYFFRNPGLLPLMAITTLGVSDKSNDDPIGRFGTGLKYAIAGALRLGQEISITIGGTPYYFFTQPEIAKTKSFNIVWMEDVKTGEKQRLGYSTELGKHWEPWMYLRELYSNCKDEGGTMGWLDKDSFQMNDKEETIITVAGNIFQGVLENMNQFILQSSPIKELSWMNLHPRVDSMGRPKIFLKGILVGELSKNFEFDIDMKADVRLTEDRVVYSADEVASDLADSILASSEEDMIEAWITNKDSNHIATAARGYIGGPETLGYQIVQKIWNKYPFRLNESWKPVAQWYFKPDDTAMTFELNEVQKSQFEKGKVMLKKLGFDKDVEWSFVDPGDKTFGFVRGGKLYLCKAAFDNGTAFLTQTMVEEYLHHVNSVEDFSREFQDILLAKLVALGQELHGEL